MKHIVIAGGGFAGVRLARRLSKEENVHVTLINETEDFRYSPALYRAATGFKIGTAKLPLEWMLLDSSNTSLLIDSVKEIRRKERQLVLGSGELVDFDYVVFALGSVTSYFDIKGVDKHAYGIKSAEEVVEFKDHIHESLTKKSNYDRNFVIVGGGPTGVELAAALGSYLKHVSKRHKIRYPRIKVYLVEAAPRLLGQMSDTAANKATRRLQKLGVYVLTNTRVQSESANRLKTNEGVINTDNVIWTAGTINNPFFKKYPEIFKLNKRGKVIVGKHLQVDERVYVCGDNAATLYSGLASVAIRHADYISNDIKHRVNHRSRRSYKPASPFQVVPVGESWAVLQYRNTVLTGRVISWVRRMADIIGYTDVLGLMRAITIWQYGSLKEEDCKVCRR